MRSTCMNFGIFARILTVHMFECPLSLAEFHDFCDTTTRNYSLRNNDVYMIIVAVYYYK